MYKLLLCLRYLRTRYIALASIISVMLGVATMIVVNSVMAGFSSEMRDRIHGILADVVVETNSLDGAEDIERHKAIIEQVAGEYIEGMTGTVEVYGMLTFDYAGQYMTRPVTLIGIEPEGKAQVGPLVEYLASYQPKMDGDEIVEPARRTPDTPPSWELTEKDRDYRQRRLERERWLMDGPLHGAPAEDDPSAVFDEFDTAAASTDGGDGGTTPPATADDAPEFGPSEVADSAEATDEPPPFVEDGEVPEFVGAVPDIENPFEPAVGADDDADPAEPLDARIYVGIQLVSFPYEDSETGETETMMMVRPGDDVKLSTVTSGRPPEAVHFPATIVDVFKSGMSEYDSNLIFCNIEYLQRVRGMIDPVSKKRAITSVQIKLKDFDDAKEVVSRLRATFPPGSYKVSTWVEKQGPLLDAVEVESAILNVLLFLIIAVAGFGILAIFFMIVVEKTRDIGILKALGASSRGVLTIFLSYGLALGIVGSGVGVILGLLFVKYINHIERFITWCTGRKVFDEKIYYFPEIPTSVSPSMVVWVAVGAITIAVLASILPARRASRLAPVESLRYE